MASSKDRKSIIVVPVRVHARGSRSEIHGVRDGRLHVKTTAPPVDGRANRDVTRQLATAFGVAPSRVSIKSGEARRDKIFVVSSPAIVPPWAEDLKRNP